jgi:hypothetical protein
MRSKKLLVVSATMLACTSLATASFADDTRSPSGEGPTGATGTPPPSTTPTSTTRTTSADDATAASSTPVTAMTSSPSTTGESTVIYNRRTPNKAVLITGTSLLVGTYVTTAALAGGNGSVADKDLYIPIVGPWINIGDRPSSTRSNSTRDTLLIAGSGVLQGAGAVMAVASFFIPEKVPVARIQAGTVKMEIMPTAAAGTAGLGALGTF